MNYQALAVATRDASSAIERDGALRSTLRRATTNLEVMGLDAVGKFAVKLMPIAHFSPDENDTVAESCMILIAQRNVMPFKNLPAMTPLVPDRLALMLAEKAGERSLLSQLRFQRLLRASDPDDRLKQMRRAIALLNSPIHPFHVVLGYCDLHQDVGRRRFARAYFAGPAANANPSTEADVAASA